MEGRDFLFLIFVLAYPEGLDKQKYINLILHLLEDVVEDRIHNILHILFMNTWRYICGSGGRGRGNRKILFYPYIHLGIILFSSFLWPLGSLLQP